MNLYNQLALPGPLLGLALSVSSELTNVNLQLALPRFDLSGAMDYLLKANLPHLQVLDVSFNNLSSEHFAVLADGNWPKMQELSLGYNQLNPAALSAIAQGSWPLMRVIDLGNCELDTPAMKVFITGNWPVMQKVSFRMNRSDVESLLLLGLGQQVIAAVKDQSRHNHYDTTLLSVVKDATFGGHPILGAHRSCLWWLLLETVKMSWPRGSCLSEPLTKSEFPVRIDCWEITCTAAS